MSNSNWQKEFFSLLNEKSVLKNIKMRFDPENESDIGDSAVSDEQAEKENVLDEYDVNYYSDDKVGSKVSSTIEERLDDELFKKFVSKKLQDIFVGDPANDILDMLKRTAAGKIFYQKSKNRKSQDVVYIQLALGAIDDKYIDMIGKEGGADSDYGNKTTKAVAQFQRDAGVKVDGSFGKTSAMAALVTFNKGGMIADVKKVDGDQINKYYSKNKKSAPKSSEKKDKKKNTSGDTISGAIDSTKYDVLPDPENSKAMGKKYPKIPRPQFVEKFGPMAIKAIKGTGIYPSTVLAQAALESGWATKRLGDNGLFGVKGATRRDGKSIPIKPKGAWKGKVGLFHTTEKVGAKKLKVKRYFRVYDSIEDSFKDHVDVLSKSRYSKALNTDDPYEQVMEIGEAGYAHKGEKGNTYGPYLKKMLPGIIKEMEKQGIDNKKGNVSSLVGENKAAMKEFLKLLLKS